MKETGIVRRIDELGRVVIPKELRKTLRLREGEQMEIFTTAQSELVLKRYSALGASADFTESFCKALAKATGKRVAICDSSQFIAAHGKNLQDIEGDEISAPLFEILSRRKPYDGEKKLAVAKNSETDYNSLCVVPLLASGDLYGGVVLFSDGHISSSDMQMCSLVADMISATLE